MDLWIPLTVFAAFFQTARSVVQAKAALQFGVAAPIYARFLYGTPVAIGLLFALAGTADVPAPSAAFLSYMAIGGLAQILGNALFINLTRTANFAVVTAFAKVETLTACAISFFLLNESIALLGIGGIAVTSAGFVVLATARNQHPSSFPSPLALKRPAVLGLAVGGLYAIGSTCFRAATLTLDTSDILLCGLVLLAWVTAYQCLLMGGYLTLRTPSAFGEALRRWRQMVPIGVLGTLSSAFWFGALALQKAGYVLTVGQVEALFAVTATHMLLKQRVTPREVGGIALTVGGIILVAMAP